MVVAEYTRTIIRLLTEPNRCDARSGTDFPSRPNQRSIHFAPLLNL